VVIDGPRYEFAGSLQKITLAGMVSTPQSERLHLRIFNCQEIREDFSAGTRAGCGREPGGCAPACWQPHSSGIGLRWPLWNRHHAFRLSRFMDASGGSEPGPDVQPG
jgi:hypothetical protein